MSPECYTFTVLIGKIDIPEIELKKNEEGTLPVYSSCSFRSTTPS